MKIILWTSRASSFSMHAKEPIVATDKHKGLFYHCKCLFCFLFLSRGRTVIVEHEGWRALSKPVKLENQLNNSGLSAQLPKSCDAQIRKHFCRNLMNNYSFWFYRTWKRHMIKSFNYNQSQQGTKQIKFPLKVAHYTHFQSFIIQPGTINKRKKTSIDL